MMIYHRLNGTMKVHAVRKMIYKQYVPESWIIHGKIVKQTYSILNKISSPKLNFFLLNYYMAKASLEFLTKKHFSGGGNTISQGKGKKERQKERSYSSRITGSANINAFKQILSPCHD